MYYVSIEWDGDKPPTKWYNRLRSLGLHVRGDKSEDPITRRISHYKGTNGNSEEYAVIAQEGSIQCASQSLAETLANYAKQLGARQVMIGETDRMDHIAITATALYGMQRMESLLGRRGKPAEVMADFVVTCMEEARTFEVADARFVVNCPHCHGFSINTRIGKIMTYALPAGSIFEAWVRTRFSSPRGLFEVPVIDDTAPQPPSLTDIHHESQAEKAVVDMIGKNTAFLSKLVKLPDGKAFTLLDAIFASFAYHTDELRNKARVRMVTELFIKGVDPAKVKLAQMPGVVDALDASAILGYAAVSYWQLSQ